jgi:hypothetical protein
MHIKQEAEPTQFSGRTPAYLQKVLSSCVSSESTTSLDDIFHEIQANAFNIIDGSNCSLVQEYAGELIEYGII